MVLWGVGGWWFVGGGWVWVGDVGGGGVMGWVGTWCLGLWWWH